MNLLYFLASFPFINQPSLSARIFHTKKTIQDMVHVSSEHVAHASRTIDLFGEEKNPFGGCSRSKQMP